jgi:NADH-quinone oxidoreductase subunit L
MTILGVLAVFGGVVQIPGVTHVVESFLDPTFADSRFAGVDVSTGHNVLVLVAGAICSIAGIAIAYDLYVRRPGMSVALAHRYRRLHDFLFHKWYFDELYDFAIVRPMKALGRGASGIFEPEVIDGVTSGTTDAVRGGSRLIRIAQSGLLRNYALLLLTGVTALGLYFLIIAR